jgi:hypothetical protein
VLNEYGIEMEYGYVPHSTPRGSSARKSEGALRSQDRDDIPSKVKIHDYFDEGKSGKARLLTVVQKG